MDENVHVQFQKYSITLSEYLHFEKCPFDNCGRKLTKSVSEVCRLVHNAYYDNRLLCSRHIS